MRIQGRRVKFEKTGVSLRKRAGEGVSGSYGRWISGERSGLDPAGGRASARQPGRLTGGASGQRGRGQADRRGQRAARGAGRLTGGALLTGRQGVGEAGLGRWISGGRPGLGLA